MKPIISFFMMLALQSICMSQTETPAENIEQNGLYRLWDSSQSSSVGYTMKSCEDSTRHGHLISNTPHEGYLKKECVPDVLYSWGNDSRIDWFKEVLSLEKPIRTTEIFFSQSPSGSYGYGLYPVRLKIKPDVLFKVRRTFNNRPCAELSNEEARKTVFVISWEWNNNDGLDYIICHSDVIESWSYGTKEHYDEVVKDVNWALSHPVGEYSLYAHSPRGWWYMNGDNQLTTESGYQSTKEHFKNILNIWIEAIAQKKEVIFYNKGVKPNREEHFRARNPIYYNDR